MKPGTLTACLAVATFVGIAAPASAQNASNAVYLTDSASPFGTAELTNADAAGVEMPKLAFTVSAENAGDFDKYYYFHRADTDFATAYADIRECDGYARGLQSGVAYAQTPYPYAGTIAGAVGSAIGSAMAQMIFGSGEKRRMRRVNMRTCMHFKGYQRYGLPKDLWDKFNFEEGLSGVSEEKRQAYLKQQALVASAGTLQGKELGL